MEIQVNGVTLYYEVLGNGPKPFIFLHGNGEDHKTFTGIEKYLGDSYTLYLVDSRGHGQSCNLEEITYGDIAEDLISFIKSLNLKKPHVFGYSDGGNVALIAAIAQTDLLADIMIAGANATPEGLGTALRAMKEEYKYKPNKYLKMMLDEPNLSSDDLSRINNKVYVVRGEHDVITRDHTQWIAQSIPNSEYIEVENQDHGSYVSDSLMLSTIIKKYMTEDTRE